MFGLGGGGALGSQSGGGGRGGRSATRDTSILLRGGRDKHIPDTALGLFRPSSGLAIKIFGNFLPTSLSLSVSCEKYENSFISILFLLRIFLNHILKILFQKKSFFYSLEIFTNYQPIFFYFFSFYFCSRIVTQFFGSSFLIQ